MSDNLLRADLKDGPSNSLQSLTLEEAVMALE